MYTTTVGHVLDYRAGYRAFSLTGTTAHRELATMSDSAQLIRQWTLLRGLSARRQGATLKELATEAGVSQKTILRDLNLLRRLAFPIEESVGEFGRKHWRMTDAGGLPSLNFSLEEAAALYLGRQYLEGLAGTLFWSGAQSAFAKIKSALGDAALRQITKLATRFYLQSHRLTDYTDHPPVPSPAVFSGRGPG